MEKAKNIFHILLIILLVLSLVVIGVFAYYKLFDNDATIGINNESQLAEPFSITSVEQKTVFLSI